MAFVDLLNSHLENVQIEDTLATGRVDTEEKYLAFRLALRQYGFNFTTRSSRKENYALDGKCDGDTKRKIPGRGSLMFKSSSDVSVPFFGFPFIVETTIYYTCSQGIKYYGSKRYPDEMFREGDPLAKKRRRPKATQKIGCQARMTVKKIKVFSNEDYYVTRDNWREKKAAIDVLRTDLETDGKTNSFIRYCLVMSLDTAHNHGPIVKPGRTRKNTFDPARKVLKLHDQVHEALDLLNSDLVTKCTNISTLTNCCNSLKTIINELKDSIERNDGVGVDQIAAALEKMSQKATLSKLSQLQCCTNSDKRSGKDRKKSKTEEAENEGDMKMEVVDIAADIEQEQEQDPDSGGHIIELPNVIEGTQVIWDPVNVSWIPDGQGLMIQQDPQRDIKSSILVQRRVDDSSNIGVIGPGGQNYAIVQHGSIPNLGVTVPFTMAKVVPTGTMITTSPKKAVKRNDMGVAIAIPGSIDWNQQNWSQVVISDQFQNIAGQTVWNVT